MTPTEFQRSLTALSTRDIMAKIEYLSSFEPRGINYQAQLDLYDAEIERRIYNWDTV